MTEHEDRPSGPHWPTLHDEELGRYKLFNLVQSTRTSPNTGREHVFLRLETPDWVNVVAVTDDRRLVLVEQYRHGTNAYTVEIPGGCVDPGEQPVDAATRELEEETGYRCRAIHLIGVVEPNPAFLSNRCWTFLAIGCRPDGDIDPDPSEEITLRLIDLESFTRLIDDRTIGHALVVAAHDHLKRGLERGAPWARELAT